MSHASINFPTKKALKEAIAQGRSVRLKHILFPEPENGPAVIEGPWEYHRWYASVQMKDGKVVSVK